MKIGKKQSIKLYTNLVRAREFDKLFASMLSRGKLLGFYHQAEGGEAPGVGACSLLKQDDFVFSHLRGHGLPHMIGKGVDPKLFLAEHTGKATGLCQGVSSWHCSAPEFGIYGSSGTMGANFPVSVGYGLAAKTNKQGQVVISCFGDGTSNRGTLHEAFLMTMNWKLPVVWVCENNELAMYVSTNEHHPMEDIASLALGYGMPFDVVDGQDVIAVAESVQPAVARARKGEGPSFIECKTVRYHEHDIGMPDLVGVVPRTEDDIAKLRERDPVEVCQKRLLAEKVLTQEDVERIGEEVADEIESAEQFVEESPQTDPSILDQQLLYAE